MQRQLVLLSVCTYDINNWVQGKLVFDAQCLVCGLRKFRINMPQKLISTLKIFVVLLLRQKQLERLLSFGSGRRRFRTSRVVGFCVCVCVFPLKYAEPD